MGTGGMNDVDISWIPQETLNVMSEFHPCLKNRFLFHQLPVYYQHQASQLIQQSRVLCTDWLRGLRTII